MCVVFFSFDSSEPDHFLVTSDSQLPPLTSNSPTRLCCDWLVLFTVAGEFREDTIVF